MNKNSRTLQWTLITLMVAGLLLGVSHANSAQANISAALDMWAIPSHNSLPSGIDYDPIDNHIYFAQFNAGRIGRIDPFSNTLTEWPALDGPNELRVIRGSGNAVVLEPPTVYYTASTANAVSVLNPINGTLTADFAPTNNSFPNGLAMDVRGFVPLAYYTGRQANTFGLYDSSASQSGIGAMAVSQNVQPTFASLSVSSSVIQPVLTQGNPALPPAAAFTQPFFASPYIEWNLNNLSFTQSTAPEGLVVDAIGGVWMGTSADTLLYFDQNSFFAYDLPVGSSALNLAIDALGNIWFTEGFSHKIGMLVPLTRDVFEWTLPSGGQPYDIAIDPVTHMVWFTEREGQRIGMLDPSTNELLEFTMTGNVNPLHLAIDNDGAVWFTAERGNFVGRLSVSVLGNP